MDIKASSIFSMLVSLIRISCMLVSPKRTEKVYNIPRDSIKRSCRLTLDKLTNKYSKNY